MRSLLAWCYDCGKKVLVRGTQETPPEVALYNGQVARCPFCGGLTDAIEVQEMPA
jgi:DNA-directed RNA polymerase subunit RPC12/RpoP